MRKIKPLLGALSVVGKDIQGRKIILPTHVDKEKTKLTHRIVRYLQSKLKSRKRMKDRYEKLTVNLSRDITKEYMRRVNITLNQYKWSNGLFIKETHPEAFN